jgi:hypothetical protein
MEDENSYSEEESSTSEEDKAIDYVAKSDFFIESVASGT